MLATNLKVLGVVLGTILLYTLVANAIPQVESEVPRELALGADVSTDEIVQAGRELYEGAGGCTACHGLGTRAPNLLVGQEGGEPIGARCGTRVSGEDCKAYLHQSLVEPQAYVVEGFQPIMPVMSRTLSPAQIWALVAFLESQGGEVTVTGADLAPAEAAPAGGGPSVGGPAPATASLDPLEIMRANQCLACHKVGEEGGVIGPSLDDLGARADANYIRRSILQPNADTAAGFAAVAGTMPATFGAQLSAAQLESLVDYLAARR